MTVEFLAVLRRHVAVVADDVQTFRTDYTAPPMMHSVRICPIGESPLKLQDEVFRIRL